MKIFFTVNIPLHHILSRDNVVSCIQHIVLMYSDGIDQFYIHRRSTSTTVKLPLTKYTELRKDDNFLLFFLLGTINCFSYFDAPDEDDEDTDAVAGVAGDEFEEFGTMDDELVDVVGGHK